MAVTSLLEQVAIKERVRLLLVAIQVIETEAGEETNPAYINNTLDWLNSLKRQAIVRLGELRLEELILEGWDEERVNHEQC